jgi:hypothetical protein
VVTRIVSIALLAVLFYVLSAAVLVALAGRTAPIFRAWRSALKAEDWKTCDDCSRRIQAIWDRQDQLIRALTFGLIKSLG